jgi:hypothetical protein
MEGGRELAPVRRLYPSFCPSGRFVEDPGNGEASALKGSPAYRTLPLLRGPKPVRLPRPVSGLNPAFLSIVRAIGTVRVAAGRLAAYGRGLVAAA